MRSIAARNGRSTAITSNRGGTSVYNREARPAYCTVSVKGRPSLQDLNYRDITPMNSWGSFVTAWSNQLSPPEISREINSTFSEVNQNRGRKPRDLFLISHEQDPRTTFKYYPSISHGPRKQIRKRYQ